MTALLLATRNTGKLSELRSLLDASDLGGIAVWGLRDVEEFPEAPETGATFAENALAKARDAAAATGLAAVADDSGLAVERLLHTRQLLHHHRTDPGATRVDE